MPFELRLPLGEIIVLNGAFIALESAPPHTVKLAILSTAHVRALGEDLPIEATPQKPYVLQIPCREALEINGALANVQPNRRLNFFNHIHLVREKDRTTPIPDTPAGRLYLSVLQIALYPPPGLYHDFRKGKGLDENFRAALTGARLAGAPTPVRDQIRSFVYEGRLDIALRHAKALMQAPG